MSGRSAVPSVAVCYRRARATNSIQKRIPNTISNENRTKRIDSPMPRYTQIEQTRAADSAPHNYAGGDTICWGSAGAGEPSSSAPTDTNNKVQGSHQMHPGFQQRGAVMGAQRLRSHRASFEDIQVIADILRPGDFFDANLARAHVPSVFLQVPQEANNDFVTQQSQGFNALGGYQFYPIHQPPVQSRGYMDFGGGDQYSGPSFCGAGASNNSGRSFSTTSTSTAGTWGAAGCSSMNPFLSEVDSRIKQEPQSGDSSCERTSDRSQISENFLRLVNSCGDEKTKPAVKPTFRCPHPGCGRVFSWEWSMKEHEQKHEVEKMKPRDFICHFHGCNKAFFTKSCLKSHLKIHTRKPNAFACKVDGCNKRYSTSEGLRLHTRNHHEVDKRWECPADGCSKKFVRQSDMRLHIMRIHAKERPHPCKHDGCSKSFACFSELRRHELSHIRKFKKLERMKRHMKLSMESV